MDKTHVRLTARQQNVIAFIAQHMSGFLYTLLCEQPVSALGMLDFLENLHNRYDLKPQELDEIYDIMHRTGANL